MNKQRYNVSRIEIDFGKDSFAEWANGMEEQDADDIARWMSAYHAQVTEALQQKFPGAEISVFEGYDQLVRSSTVIQYTSAADGTFEADAEIVDYMLDPEVDRIIEDVLNRVSNDGSFWDA